MVYPSFAEFYENAVRPIKTKNPTWIRLDGKMDGSSPKIFGKFKHFNKTWEVHKDTWIAPLDYAYHLIKKSTKKVANPFKQEPTQKRIRMCLVPARNRKYVYIYETKRISSGKR